MFAKRCVLSCLSNVDNIEEFHRAVFELEAPKAEIKGVLASDTVAMVT